MTIAKFNMNVTWVQRHFYLLLVHPRATVVSLLYTAPMSTAHFLFCLAETSWQVREEYFRFGAFLAGVWTA